MLFVVAVCRPICLFSFLLLKFTRVLFPVMFLSAVCKIEPKMVSYDVMTPLCLSVFVSVAFSGHVVCFVYTCNTPLSAFLTCNKSISCKKEAQAYNMQKAIRRIRMI